MLRDWLTAAFFCTVFLLVIRLVLRLVSVVDLWFAFLPAVGYALLFFFFFSSFLPPRRLSAALRVHRRFDVLLAVLVPVLLYFVLLFTSDSSAVALSLDPPQRHFVVSYIFVDVSPAPPTPLLSIAPFVIVGSR